MTDLKIFAERLRFAREAAGLSQAELSMRIYVVNTVIRNYEAARILPSLPRAIALADALNVSLDWLCGRTNER